MEKLVLIRLMICFCMLSEVTFGQDGKGRWSVGLHEGVNLWLSDFNTKKFGPGAEVTIRYGLTRSFSFGLIQGYDELKTEGAPSFAHLKYDYTKLYSVNTLFTTWFHLAPEKDLSPYLYGGLGMVFYRQHNETETPLNEQLQGSPLIAFGAGIEEYLSESGRLTIDLGLKIANDNLDRIRHGLPESYVTARVGLKFYLGSASESSSPEMGIAESKARVRLRDTVIVIRKDTVISLHRDTVRVVEEGKNLVLSGVNFGFGSARLTEKARVELEKAFILLITNPEGQVEIIGHTDSLGAKEYNDNLSLRRAKAVKNWLVKKGIPEGRMTVSGKGYSEPISSNGTAEGRGKNRRIEFNIR